MQFGLFLNYFSREVPPPLGSYVQSWNHLIDNNHVCSSSKLERACATLEVSNGMVYSVSHNNFLVGVNYDLVVHAKPLPGFIDGNLRVVLREGGREILPITTIRLIAGVAMFTAAGPAIFRATAKSHNLDLHVSGKSPPPDDGSPTMTIRLIISPTL